MSTPTTLDAGEILLYGQRFRLNGPVQENLVSVFPGKVVIGDTTRASDPLASTYVMETWTGGAGRRIMDPAVDIDRFHWSTATTWYTRQLTLGPAVRFLTTPSFGDTNPRQVRAGAVFRDLQYVAWDEKVCVIDINEVAQAPSVTLAQQSTQLFVGRYTTGANAGSDRLFACYGTGYQVFDGTTWTAGVGGEGAAYMVVWDDKIVKIDNSGILKATTDGVTWAQLQGGVLALPSNSVTGLMIYPDQNGEDAIHIATVEGLYFYDESSGHVRPTRLILPRLTGQGAGSAVHQGALYFHSIGAGAAQYLGSATSPIGLNADDGLPPQYRGSITQMASTLNWLVASVEAVSNANFTTNGGWIPGADVGGMADVAPLQQGFCYLAVLPTNASKWHILYSYPNLAAGSKWVGSSSPQGKYRLWFGMDGRLGVMDLYPDVLNPLDNTIQQYTQLGELWTPWNNMGWSEIAKLGMQLSLQVDNTGINSDPFTFTPGTPGQQCTIDTYCAMDNNDTWYYLGSAPTTGITNLRLGNLSQGLVFRSIRFRFVLNRCEDAFHSPVLRWATLTFLKEIPARWGYRITLDCTKAYAGLEPEDQIGLLRRMCDPDDTQYGAVLGTFQAWVNGKWEKRLVKINTLAGVLGSGPDTRGEVHLSVVSPINPTPDVLVVSPH